MQKLIKTISGILLSVVIAVPAWILGKTFPVIGAPVLGILFGMVLAFFKRPAYLESGIKYTSKKVLQYAIILLGFEMNLYHVFDIGKQTLLLMVFTLCAAFLTAYFVGKLLKLDSNTKTLIGVGSAICGGSAIAATAPVIGAKDEEIARSISTIFLFNVAAAFIFPFLGHIFGMSDYHFGLWAGTAVNDTSSVVAAGYSFSNSAGDLAVIVKLTRTLMIVPVTLILSLYISKRRSSNTNKHYSIVKVFPWFVLGFIVASILRTFSPISEDVTSFLSQAGKFLIVMSMASIGLNTNILKLVKNGGKPILLGFICWLAISITSLGVQYLLLQ